MFVNLIVFSLLIITSATFQWEKEEEFHIPYHKYNFDENYRLLKMHSTPEAKLFLEGCRGLYSDVCIVFI